MRSIIERIILDNNIIDKKMVSHINDIESYLSEGEINIIDFIELILTKPDEAIVSEINYFKNDNMDGIVLTGLTVCLGINKLRIYNDTDGGQLISLSHAITVHETFIGGGDSIVEVVLFAHISYLMSNETIKNKVLKCLK